MDVLSSVIERMHRLPRLFPLFTSLGLFAIVGAASCDKVPLLAPTGTVINLVVPADASAGLNSTMDITAVLIENGSSGTGTATTSAGAGTPVQNGTVVSFTTSLGSIEPAEARTSNGKVTVRFTSGGVSGTATITAYSGGAKSTTTVKIGAANAKTITVSATPQNLPSTGGTATVSARVDDVNGNGIAGIPITFTTDKGSLSSNTATTNSLGIATTTLTTNAAAKVTVSLGGGTLTGTVSIGVSTRSTVSIATSTTSTGLVVSAPVSFTVTPGAGALFSNAIVSYGDGSSKPLGTLAAAQSVTHFFTRSGIYDVTVSATDIEGVVTTAVTQVAIGGLTGSATSSPASPVDRNVVVTFTATVDQSAASIEDYVWSFPDATGTTTIRSQGKTQTYIFPTAMTPGPYTVTVTVNPLFGQSFDIELQIIVK